MPYGFKALPIGAKVQHRNGYIHVKVEGDEGEAKWMSEARRTWELHRGPLKEGDRVFHVNGDRTNNHISNLAKVHYNSTKFVFLKESKLLFCPPGGIKQKPQLPKTNVRQLATGKYRHLLRAS